MPNQWADLSSYVSRRASYQCQKRHKLSFQCQHGNKLLIDQCQTNGHDLNSYVQMSTSNQTETQGLNRSMPNQWARSQFVYFNEDQLSNRYGHNLVSYQCQSEACNYRCQTNGHNSQLVNSLNTRNDYALAVNSTQSLYQLMYLSCYKLKLIDLITIPTSVSISHD